MRKYAGLVDWTWILTRRVMPDYEDIDDKGGTDPNGLVSQANESGWAGHGGVGGMHEV